MKRKADLQRKRFISSVLFSSARSRFKARKLRILLFQTAHCSTVWPENWFSPTLPTQPDWSSSILWKIICNKQEELKYLVYKWMERKMDWQTGALSAVMKALLQSAVVKKELKQKAVTDKSILFSYKPYVSPSNASLGNCPHGAMSKMQ